MTRTVGSTISPGRQPGSADEITILRTKGLPATKTLGRGPDGRLAVVASYGNAKRFAFRQEPVTGLESLARVLDGIRPDEFVIRGEPLPGADPRDTVRRLHPDPLTGERPTFREEARRWLLLDFDTVEAPTWLDPAEPEDAASYLRSRLPDAFHAASCRWAWTASAGVAPGLRMRLGFWLDRPVGKAFLDRWLAAAPVDASVFRPVQPIYVARPILRGVPDPVPRRSGVLVDVDDTVPVPELPAEVREPAGASHSPEGRRYVSGASRWLAERGLVSLCKAVARAGKGSRHRCLLWAAARAVELDDAIPRAEIAAELLAAARRAGLEEPEAELSRQILNGFKIGVFGAGAAA